MASGFSVVAAHESEENSNHIVVLPRSIKIVRLQVMQEQINSGQNSVEDEFEFSDSPPTSINKQTRSRVASEFIWST